MTLLPDQPLRHVSAHTNVAPDEVLDRLDGTFLALSREPENERFGVDLDYDLDAFLRFMFRRKSRWIAVKTPISAGDLAYFLLHVFATSCSLPPCSLAYELPDGRLIHHQRTVG